MNAHFVGWLRDDRGRWRMVVEAMDEAACWDALLAVRSRDADAGRDVRRAGEEPGGRDVKRPPARTGPRPNGQNLPL